ncbi:MAG: hypothetical protein J0H35_13810 [Rhodospirillales bacterium]|nr:hypothetical protein [Rhodospirillales bacterium]
MSMKPKITEVVNPTVDATAKTIEAGTATANDAAAKVSMGFEQTQTKMKEGVEKAMKTAEEMMAFGQGNVEALVKSS